jgi:hypothetical protein
VLDGFPQFLSVECRRCRFCVVHGVIVSRSLVVAPKFYLCCPHFLYNLAEDNGDFSELLIRGSCGVLFEVLFPSLTYESSHESVKLVAAYLNVSHWISWNVSEVH